jgi:DNA recombination-dependent growth factor C
MIPDSHLKKSIGEIPVILLLFSAIWNKKVLSWIKSNDEPERYNHIPQAH